MWNWAQPDVVVAVKRHCCVLSQTDFEPCGVAVGITLDTNQVAFVTGEIIGTPHPSYRRPSHLNPHWTKSLASYGTKIFHH